MAEGGGLLNRYTVKSRIGGSNPPLSAISIKPLILQPETHSRGLLLDARSATRCKTAEPITPLGKQVKVIRAKEKLYAVDSVSRLERPR